MVAATNLLHPLDFLSPEDYRDLKSSGLSDEQLLTLGHFTIADRTEGKQRTGVNHRGLAFRYLDPSNGLPYLNSKGKPFYRMKPRDWAEDWSDPTESPPKYLSARDEGNKPYFSPLLQHFNHLAKKPHIDLDITEGEKKTDALSAHEIFAVGLAGVYGWLDKSKRGSELDIPPAPIIEDDQDALTELDEPLKQSRMIPELKEAIDWQYRRTNIVFDSDSNSKRQVRCAIKDLAIALQDLGAEPYIVRLPNEIDGSKNGVDDFICRHGIAAYRILRQIAKPAFKQNKMNFPQEPTAYEKIVLAFVVLKDSWRYRPGVGWFNWTGTHWVNRSTSEFHEDVVKFQDAQNWELPVGKDLIGYQLQSRLLVKDEQWNPTHLLGFANGVLSIKDNRFCEGHNHENFLTATLPYDYSPLSACPRWIEFLREALNNDQGGIELLQAFIKWVLLPKPKNKKAEIEKCLDLLGPKGSGKGTFLDVLVSLVGSENIGAIGSKTFESSTHLADLLDKKLSIDTDAFGFLSNVGLFNKVVSNEPVSIKRLYKDPVTTRLGTVIVRAYNRILEVPDGSEGLDRRIIAIHFNNQPQTIDLELSEKLQAELPGIFTWAWSISNAEMKRRITWAGSVESVASASVKRFEANNPEYSFLKAVFPTGNPQVRAGELYHSYQTWCKDDAGISPKKRRKFSEALQALGCEHKRTMDGYLYSIPSMNEFDVVKFLGLSKKILLPEKFGAENVHNVHAAAETLETLGVSSMNILSHHERSNVHIPSENVHIEGDETNLVPPPPFEVGETFERWGEYLRVERVGVSTLYCHVANGTVEQNRSYVKVPFDEAQKLKNEHSKGGHEHSNVHTPDRMFMLETSGVKGFQESHEHYEHSQPQTSLGEEILKEATEPTPSSWTKDLFAAIDSTEPAEPKLEFPYLGCEVGKLENDQKVQGWVGYIREITADSIQIWWTGDWVMTRNGKPRKGKDGQPEEKWTRHKLNQLYPRTNSDTKQHPQLAARNEKYLDTARQKAQALAETPNQDALASPYHARTNPPKTGDRVKEFRNGKLGTLVEIRKENPKYSIQWEGEERPKNYDLTGLQILDVRRIADNANG